MYVISLEPGGFGNHEPFELALAKLHSSVIIQPLVLSNALKIVLYQKPHAIFDCLFLDNEYKRSYYYKIPKDMSILL